MRVKITGTLSELNAAKKWYTGLSRDCSVRKSVISAFFPCSGKSKDYYMFVEFEYFPNVLPRVAQPKIYNCSECLLRSSCYYASDVACMCSSFRPL